MRVRSLMVYGRAAYTPHGDIVFILTTACWRLLGDSLIYLISGSDSKDESPEVWGDCHSPCLYLLYGWSAGVVNTTLKIHASFETPSI
jgi:hypothetical protein